MTTRTTYNLLRRGITALALVCISVITFAQDPEPTYVAQIGDTPYTTLQAAIDAATDGQTVELIANTTETETYSIADKHITINFATFTITASHNDGSAKVFTITSTGGLTLIGSTGGFTDDKVYGIFYNQGTLTVEGGQYSTTVDDYGVIFNEGGMCTVNGGTLTGAYSAIYAKGTNTVNVANGTIEGASIGIKANAGTTLNVTGGTITATNETKKYSGLYLVGEGTTVTVSGGAIFGWNGISVRQNAVLTVEEGATITAKNAAVIGNGNDSDGGTTITINGGTMTSDDTGIYHPQVGTLTIAGGTITGGKLGVEIRAGVLSVTGGSIKANATEYLCTPNGNGTTTVGAALAIAQHTTKQDIAVTISGGTFTGVKAISESNPQQNDPAPQVTMSVTNGTFNGGITVVDVQGGFISGGTYSIVDEDFENYLKSGYAVKANSGEPATYSVVPQTNTTINQSITGDAKTAAEALAANTATATTTGLAYDQSLEISINNVAVDGGVVKTAIFEVTPKDVNGNPISSWSGEVTFRLPISAGVAVDKWVNLKHKGTPISASQVAADGDNRYVAVTTSSFSPFEYRVLLNDPVAQIGETKYETMADAIADAPDDTETTIVILADIATDITIPAKKNIALTIGTHSISGAIANAGTLAISDGTITGAITNSGTISITGGTFTTKPDAGWIASGYEVMVGESNTYVVAAEGTAEAKIVTVVEEVENITLYQTIADAIVAASTNETTITLLKDVAADEIIIPADANITLVVAEGKTLSKTITNAGMLTIFNGTFTGAITNNNETEGSLIITGGTFQVKPTGYTCEEGKDLIINGEGKYEVTDITSAEAQIGNNMYLTIGDAITAAGETATTITLLKNLEGEERSIIIPATADITLKIADGVTLTKPVSVDGKLAITSGTISEATTITITNFAAVVKITAGVTHPAVALSTELQTENVLKSKGVGEPVVTTYWAEKKFEATIALPGEATAEQIAAAEALVANTSIKEVTGHATNQSLTITVTSVELSASKVTKAEFEVKLIDTDGEEVTGTVDPAVTFHLPVSDGLEGKWANLWHNTTAIPGMNVLGATNGYVTVSTTSFSPFSYEIIETPIAQIGETKFGTVAAAIEKATETETEIKLLQSVSEAISVADGKNVKFIIGELTVSGDITNAGILAIADGTISGADKTITNTGALTISGGTISNPVTVTAGTLTISGGTFSETITTSGEARLTISNGTITGALTVGGSGANTISGGTISGAVATNTATTISGGEITSNITNSAALTITDGTFTGNIANTDPGTVAISGGLHTVLPVSGFCATGYMPIMNEAGKYEMTNHWTITDATVIDGSHFEYLTSTAGYKVATATYKRNTGMVSAGNAETMYGTICLPFDIKEAIAGITLYKATSIEGNTLTITEVGYPVTAGTPLIFKLSAVASSMTVECNDSENAISVNTEAPATTPAGDNLLVGRYTAQDITTGLGNIYYLNGDKFHQAVTKLTVPAFRAYLDITTVGSAPERLNIATASQVATALDSVGSDFSIVAIYDIQGRNIGRLQSGINIVRLSNGQTVKIIKM